MAAATAAALLAGCAGSAVQNDGAPAARPAAGGTANAARPDEAALATSAAARAERGRTLEQIQALQRERRYYASLAHIAAYQQRFGTDADLLALRAAALRETGQETEAAQAYRDLNRQGKAVDSHYGLGMIATRQGDFALAAGELRQALALEPLNPQIASALGYALMRAGALQEAKAPVMQALELDGASPVAVSRAAIWLTASGRRHDAQSLVRVAKLPAAARREVDKESALVAQAVRKQALRAAQEARSANSANSANSVPPAQPAQPAPAAPAAATAQSQTLAQAQPLARRPIKIVLTPTARLAVAGQAIPAVPAAGATTTVAASSGGN